MKQVDDALAQFPCFIQQPKICRIAYRLFRNSGIQYQFAVIAGRFIGFGLRGVVIPPFLTGACSRGF